MHCFSKNKQQKWKKISREKKQNKNNTHRGVIKQKAIRHPHTIHSQKMPPSLSCYCSVFNWLLDREKAITLPSSLVNHKLQDSNHLNLPRSKQCEPPRSPLPAVMTSCNEDHDISNGGRWGGEQIGGSWDKSGGEKCLYSWTPQEVSGHYRKNGSACKQSVVKGGRRRPIVKRLGELLNQKRLEQATKKTYEGLRGGRWCVFVWIAGVWTEFN